MFKDKKTVEILSQVEVFEGLGKAELKEIARCCLRVPFGEGEVLIQAGRAPSAFYILIKGELKVLLPERLEGRRERRASEVKLNTLKAGECFGEYSLIEKRPASASVLGARSGEVLKIPEPDFYGIMADDRIGKRVYRNLLRILIRRLRKKEAELDLVLVMG